MPNILDIFGSNAFALTTLVDAVNKVPFVPGQIGALGIFEEIPINTTTVSVEEYAGTIGLVPDTPRGAPPVANTVVKRKMRSFRVPHFPIQDTITVGEIQNVRAFGADNLTTPENVRDRKIAKMSRSLDANVEYGRVGAIAGNLLDSDGATVIYNWYTEFGISQPTTDFVLGTTTTDVLSKTLTVANTVEAALGAAAWDRLLVIAGPTFYQKFISHASVKSQFQYFQAMAGVNPNIMDLRYVPFNFGAISIVQYRGTVGGVKFVADSEAYAVPTGVPDMFQTYFAPADYMETANTEGLPRYVKAYMDPSGLNKYIGLEAQTNPLSINTRPEAVVKLTTSN